MKLSLAWISDHLVRHKNFVKDPRNAKEIATKLSQKTAEIDEIELFSLNSDQFTIARCDTCTATEITYYSPETDSTYCIPGNTEATLHRYYLLYNENGTWRRARYLDINGYRDSDLPAMYIEASQSAGQWKGLCEWQDVRLIIDNKAITHRPDLWCHRGFAREVAALLGDTLVPLEELTQQSILATPLTQINPQILQNAACDRFGLMHITNVTITLSVLPSVFRLARMDTRAINSAVDATNYVMFDIGQPLHVFDADTIQGALSVRAGDGKESCVLLDGTTHTFRDNDIVITDTVRPLSLAGVMGGITSSVQLTTKNIFVESAHFAAYAIRQSAQQHRIRTESSTRFEKGLDPAIVIQGLARFAQICAPHNDTIASCTVMGQPVHARMLELLSTQVEAIIGVAVAQPRVIEILHAFGYQVTYRDDRYFVNVPSWRFADVHAAEDVVEDIARFIGYNNIPAAMPTRLMEPVDATRIERTRALKRHLAYGLRMQEVYSYPFYDEQFLQRTHLAVPDAARLRNPVSEQAQRLVTSLIPNLFKCVLDNVPQVSQLRVFELANTWTLLTDSNLQEQKKLAYLIYDVTHKVSFYESKTELISLFDLLRLPVCWQPCTTPLAPWWDPATTANLQHKGCTIGYAGLINKAFLASFAEGYAFGVELNAELLLQYQPPTLRYQSPSKFQSTWSDLSIFVPYTKTAAQLCALFQSVDSRIISVRLIDMFEQPNWHDTRSLTFRITCNDATRTMTQEEMDGIMRHIHTLAKSEGATIR